MLSSLHHYTSQQYFCHPDHLGSSSFISDASGEACQFLAYLPYGEQWVDQRSSGSYDASYKFSGKELDAETGYNYFGARYYDSGLSVWLSVDPLAASYPGFSPYLYCAGSPLNCVDPDGQRINWLHFIGAMKFRHDCMGTKAGRQIWKDMRTSPSWYTFRYTRAVLISHNDDGTHSVLNGQMVPTRKHDAEMVYQGASTRRTRPMQIQVSTGSYHFWQDFDEQIPQNASREQAEALVERMINSGDYKLKSARSASIHGNGSPAKGRDFIFLGSDVPGALDMRIDSPEGGVKIATPLPNESITEYRQRVSGHEAGHALSFRRDFENAKSSAEFKIQNEVSAQTKESFVIKCQQEIRNK